MRPPSDWSTRVPQRSRCARRARQRAASMWSPPDTRGSPARHAKGCAPRHCQRRLGGDREAIRRKSGLELRSGGRDMLRSQRLQRVKGFLLRAERGGPSFARPQSGSKVPHAHTHGPYSPAAVALLKHLRPLGAVSHGHADGLEGSVLWARREREEFIPHERRHAQHSSRRGAPLVPPSLSTLPLEATTRPPPAPPPTPRGDFPLEATRIPTHHQLVTSPFGHAMRWSRL